MPLIQVLEVLIALGVLPSMLNIVGLFHSLAHTRIGRT
jgi:hypothetical protein